MNCAKQVRAYIKSVARFGFSASGSRRGSVARLDRILSSCTEELVYVVRLVDVVARHNQDLSSDPDLPGSNIFVSVKIPEKGETYSSFI